MALTKLKVTDILKTWMDTINALIDSISNIDINTLKQEILDASDDAVSGSDGSSSGVFSEVKHEIGTFWMSLDGSIPSGGLPHLGHLVSRSTYGDFWAWCESNKTVISESEWLAYAEGHNGCCPYYSSGDGSTTFRTPSYDQSFLKVLASTNDVGVMEEAGLPGLAGYFTLDRVESVSVAQGAFTSTKRTDIGRNSYSFPAGSKVGYTIDLDASRSNPIYGNSDTVTPQNFGIIVGVYAVGTIVSIGETDTSNLLNGLTQIEGRVGTLENGVGRCNAYIVDTWSSGTSWYRKWSDGWVEQGGQVASTVETVTLPIAMRDTNYYARAFAIVTTGSTFHAIIYKDSMTTTSIAIKVGQYENASNFYTGYVNDWEVKGYHA